MVAIIISEKGGPQRRLEVDKAEMNIGRVAGNDLILPKGNVSKRHARIVVKDGKYIIVDLKSTNGTYVNGRKIQSPQVIKAADKVYIGDFIISLDAPDAPDADLPVDVGSLLSPADLMEGLDLATPPSATLAPSGPPSSRPRGESASPFDGPPPPPFGDAGSLFGEAPGSPFGEAGEGEMAPLDLSFDEPGGLFDAPPDRGAAHAPPPRDNPLPPPPLPAVAPAPPAAPLPPPVPPAPPVAVAPPVTPPPPLAPPTPRPPSAVVETAPRPPVSPATQAPAAPPAPSAAPAPAPPVVPAAPALSPITDSPHRPLPPTRLRRLGPPPPRPAEGPLGRELEQRQAGLRLVVEKLETVLLGLEAERLSWEAFRERTENALYDLAGQLEARNRLPAGVDKEELIQAALNEATALGPLEELLMDETVREVIVNDPLHIYVCRGAEMERQRRVFSDEHALTAVIQRLVQDTGALFDAAHPSVDVRRKDGVRVTALLPPVAVRGPAVTLRRSQLEPLAMDDLIANETVSPPMVELLEACVRAGKNILVAGGSGSGKTTLLNCLAGAIAPEARIVTIEDGCELVLPQENVLALEARPATQGQAGLSSGQLVSLALRMRPDRLLLGDLSGDDALELMRAMNSGCGGVLSCIHATDAQSALERLETMCLMGGRDMPVRSVRELCATGVDLLVVLTRFASGERRMTSILEVTGLDVDLVGLEEVFRFEMDGTDRDGAVLGHFRATGYVPRFYEDLQRRGLAPAAEIFR